MSHTNIQTRPYNTGCRECVLSSKYSSNHGSEMPTRNSHERQVGDVITDALRLTQAKSETQYYCQKFSHF